LDCASGSALTLLAVISVVDGLGDDAERNQTTQHFYDILIRPGRGRADRSGDKGGTQ
jgi:hypothetical protein